MKHRVPHLAVAAVLFVAAFCALVSCPARGQVATSAQIDAWRAKQPPLSKRPAAVGGRQSLAATLAISTQPSACGAGAGVPGIGYVPAAGSQSCWWDGWATPGAPPPKMHCGQFNLSADPFSGPVADIDAFATRYGLDRRVHQQGHFGVDAETILGVGSSWLSTQCCAGSFGPPAGRSCYPTLLELHDYAAANINWSPAPPPPPKPRCGNGRPESGETCATCAKDMPAGSCDAPPPPPPPSVQCVSPKVCIDPHAPCPTCPAPPTLAAIPLTTVDACKWLKATYKAGTGVGKRVRQACEPVDRGTAYVPKVPSTAFSVLVLSETGGAP